MKHTPGPWKVEVNAETRMETDVTARNGEDYIADFGMLNGLSGGTCIQNAKLAAASPQMYNALQEINRFLNNNSVELESVYMQIPMLKKIIREAIMAAGW